MTTNDRLTEAAEIFVARFGDDAPAEAKRRADELRDAGNLRSYETWIAIYRQVKRIVGESGDRTG